MIRKMILFAQNSNKHSRQHIFQRPIIFEMQPGYVRMPTPSKPQQHKDLKNIFPFCSLLLLTNRVPLNSRNTFLEMTWLASLRLISQTSRTPSATSLKNPQRVRWPRTLPHAKRKRQDSVQGARRFARCSSEPTTNTERDLRLCNLRPLLPGQI